MPKGTSDLLYQLIHSLSKTEKAYFKKFAHKYDKPENGHLQLFDYLSKQKAYDEKKAISKFRHHPMTNQFSSAKHYLYRRIVEALKSYHAKLDVHVEVRDLIHEAEIMSHKGLITSAKSAIKRAKKKATQFEALTLYPEIMRMELNLKAKRDPRLFEEQAKEERAFIDKYENRSAYRILYYRVFSEFRRLNRTRSEEDMKKLKTIMSHDLLQNANMALSFQSKNNFYSIWGNYYSLIGEHHNDLKMRDQLLQLWQDHPTRIKERIVVYIRNLHNYCNAAFRSEKAGELKHGIEILQSIIPKSHAEEVEHFESLYLFLFKHAQLTFDEHALKEAYASISGGLKRYGNSVSRAMFLDLKFCLVWHSFIAEAFDESLGHQIELLQDRFRSREDLQVNLRIINLITHYELGNISLTESLTRSLYRLLLNLDGHRKYERAILSFLRANAREGGIDQFEVNLAKLLETLVSLREDPLENAAMQTFDVTLWIQARLNGVSMAQSLRR